MGSRFVKLSSLAPVVTRKCNKCAKPFESDGLRTCPKCTQENNLLTEGRKSAARHNGRIIRKGLKSIT